jgi:hypothetical protein
MSARERALAGWGKARRVAYVRVERHTVEVFEVDLGFFAFARFVDLGIRTSMSTIAYPSAASALREVRRYLRDLNALDVLRPLRDLVVLRSLPKMTVRNFSPLAIDGARIGGSHFAEVAFPGRSGLVEGDIVIVQTMSAPDGAGALQAPLYGFGEGRLTFAPCAVLPSPHRDAELVERRREMLAVDKAHPKGDAVWRTPLGESMKAQQLGHLEAIAGIMRERKAQGRTRLMHPTKDTATAEGVIALACGVDERGAGLEGELDVEENDNG